MIYEFRKFLKKGVRMAGDDGRIEVLKKREAVLVESVRRFSKTVAEAPKNVIDLSMFQEEERERLRNLGIASTELCHVKTALNLFRAGWDGNCQLCGEPISPKRLEAIPYVLDCIECAGKNPEPQIPQVTAQPRENRFRPAKNGQSAKQRRESSPHSRTFSNGR